MLEHGRLGETYNIGTGICLSNLDIVRQFEPVLNKQGYISRINHLPARRFDVKFNSLDCEKVKTETGWKPRVSFNDGLLMTINWLSENIEQF